MEMHSMHPMYNFTFWKLKCLSGKDTVKSQSINDSKERKPENTKTHLKWLGVFGITNDLLSVLKSYSRRASPPSVWVEERLGVASFNKNICAIHMHKYTIYQNMANSSLASTQVQAFQ